jgi:hypothetical protein
MFDIARDIEQGTEDARAYIPGRSVGNSDEVRHVQTIHEQSY